MHTVQTVMYRYCTFHPSFMFPRGPSAEFYTFVKEISHGLAPCASKTQNKKS